MSILNKIFGEKTEYVYLATDPSGKALNYRGPVGENDDPKAFTRLMARRGLNVIVTTQYLGKKIDADQNTVEV